MSNSQSRFAVSQAIPGSLVPWPDSFQYLAAPPPPAGVFDSSIGNALESNLAFTAPTPFNPYSNPGVTLDGFEQEVSPTPKASSTGSNTETVKKRKVKMHACPICKKEFSRPSGLHTHMNSHNNARPYPCTYPGCHRMFGVRSNAKRHLRTHGIAPNVLSSSSALGQLSAATDTEKGLEPLTHPYVVSFHEPMTVRDPVSGTTQDKQIVAHAIEAEEGADLSGVGGGREGNEDGRSIPFYKVRWLPLSLISRTGAAALKSVRSQRVDEDPESNESNVEGREGFAEESGSEERCIWQSSFASSRDGSMRGEGAG